ncbi:isocitrate/isopropylmalate dehydrogenase family protein [Roseovarius sp. 2305UL8-3]|uniref:isocitrate/isopropylmalate dehydrogenase family protein n=1 Tax=Roseovarius conchicola TaxID=3121636 RepID=UPI00352746F1
MSEPLHILFLPGDGIGPEITASCSTILHASAKLFDLNLIGSTAQIGFAALDQQGTTFPEPVFEEARAADAVVLGPVSHNDYPAREDGGLNPSGELRKRLDLFANIRPARTLPGVPPRCGHPADLVIVRENTEGFYADRSMHLGPGEFMPDPDMALAVRKVTRKASLRIAEAAFEQARQRNGTVTAVHKANVLRVSDGLFLDCTRQVAAQYPDIPYSENLVDSAAALLVRDAGQFDVIVTTNMYGDILSDLAAEIAGGLGLGASINASADHCVAQAQHGSAPSIAGKDAANPASLILSAAMMLNWLADRDARDDLRQAAQAIDAAVQTALTCPETRTTDLGGTLGTAAFTQVLVDLLER